MIKKKIAILLPYKENYTEKCAGAASIWTKDYLGLSKLRNITTGENKYKKYSHSCFQLELGSRYENQIIINPDNLIINLKFKVHPIYPLLELSIK